MFLLDEATIVGTTYPWVFSRPY